MGDSCMKGWKEYLIYEIGKVITGKTPSKNNPEDWGYDMPFVTPSDFNGYKKYAFNSERKLSQYGINRLCNKILPENSVLVTCIGSDMGKVVINKLKVITNQQINAIIPYTSIINNDFLYYKLISMYDTLRIFGSDGTAVPILNKNDFENLPILLPPLEEQRTIAEVLSSLDDKIDLLHRQNKTLEAMAETLFRQWFVEPCKNGLPEGWREGKLSKEFTIIMGQSPVGISYNENNIGVPMFQGNADFDFRFPKERIYTTKPIRFAEPYDTLISVRAPVGEQNMVLVKCCIGRGLAAIRHTKNKAYYTYTYFKIRSLMNQIKQFNDDGTVFGSIGKTELEALDVIIPPNEVVINFEEKAKPINDKIIKNCIQIRTLEKLRDTLLPKLMNGEIRIKI